MTKAGPQFFAVPIMDAESWGLRQHVQHAHLFRLRAAENHRWLAVVGTSGVSQVIDPHGRVVSSLPPMRPGILKGTLHPISDLSLYTQIGWLLPWGLLILFVMQIAWIARRPHGRVSL